MFSVFNFFNNKQYPNKFYMLLWVEGIRHSIINTFNNDWYPLKYDEDIVAY